eukprot:CAMPEP_0202872332 /NCGR_PEP_ID=MMETSP1391-20130828/20942_1 /ASSEMBLY_ACC=CAM_ASM_000867 /TAXON_ID=1034604 /ORGANISM="Chlamydomonas leiostraca, Strain SAG 11-49" /LENGTH=732 /DNA_ID=CAMNT_0049553349 /DNA_START=37 /DNA_END=2231 /DNA_ORIENTATION=+
MFALSQSRSALAAKAVFPTPPTSSILSQRQVPIALRSATSEARVCSGASRSSAHVDSSSSSHRSSHHHSRGSSPAPQGPRGSQQVPCAAVMAAVDKVWAGSTTRHQSTAPNLHHMEARLLHAVARMLVKAGPQHHPPYALPLAKVLSCKEAQEYTAFYNQAHGRYQGQSMPRAALLVKTCPFFHMASADTVQLGNRVFDMAAKMQGSGHSISGSTPAPARASTPTGSRAHRATPTPARGPGSHTQQHSRPGTPRPGGAPTRPTTPTAARAATPTAARPGTPTARRATTPSAHRVTPSPARSGPAQQQQRRAGTPVPGRAGASTASTAAAGVNVMETLTHVQRLVGGISAWAAEQPLTVETQYAAAVAQLLALYPQPRQVYGGRVAHAETLEAILTSELTASYLQQSGAQAGSAGAGAQEAVVAALSNSGITKVIELQDDGSSNVVLDTKVLLGTWAPPTASEPPAAATTAPKPPTRLTISTSSPPVLLYSDSDPVPPTGPSVTKVTLSNPTAVLHLLDHLEACSAVGLGLQWVGGAASEAAAAASSGNGRSLAYVHLAAPAVPATDTSPACPSRVYTLNVQDMLQFSSAPPPVLGVLKWLLQGDLSVAGEGMADGPVVVAHGCGGEDIKQLGSVLDIAVSCPIFDTQIAQGLLGLAGADGSSTTASSGSAKAPQPTGPTQHSPQQLLQAYGFGGSAKGGSQSVEEAAAGAARLVAVMDGQMSVARGSQAFKR